MELIASINRRIIVPMKNRYQKARKNVYFNALDTGIRRTFYTMFKIAKVLIPVYFLVKILQHTNVLTHIAAFFEPVMFLFGLKGDTALAIILANGLNIYAGLAVIANLTMTEKEITTLAMMILFSHSLPIETAVLKNLKVSRTLQILIRISASLLCGLIMNLVWGLFS